MRLQQGSAHKAQRPAARTTQRSGLAPSIAIIPQAVRVRGRADSALSTGKAPSYFLQNIQLKPVKGHI